MYHEFVLEAEKPMSNPRQQFVFEIAASVAEGLRTSSAKAGIRQTADFVNGMMFCGLLIEKDKARKAPRFVDAFRAGVPAAREVIEARAFRDADRVLTSMGRHVIGVSDMTPGEMLVTMGLSAEGVIKEIADEYDLSAAEQIELVTFAIVLAIISTTKEEVLDLVLSAIVQSAEEKADLWDEIIPSDDEISGGKEL